MYYVNTHQVRLNLESLEDRLTPTVTPLHKFALDQISFTSRSDGTEQWSGIGSTSFYDLGSDVARTGWLTPLHQQVFRLTTVTPQGAAFVASLRNGWIAGNNGSTAFIKNIATSITSSFLDSLPVAGGYHDFLPVSISNYGTAFGNRLISTSSTWFPAYWKVGEEPTAFSLPLNATGRVLAGNAAGTYAAGWLHTDTTDMQAVLFRPGAGIMELNSAGYSRTIAHAVNDEGTFVAGTVRNPEFINGVDSGTTNAAVWRNGTLTELRWPNGQLVRMRSSEVLQLADQNYVVGVSLQGPFIWHASFNGIDSPYQGAQLLGGWFQQQTGGALPAYDQVKDIAQAANGDLHLALYSSTQSKGYVAVVPAGTFTPTFPTCSLDLQGTTYPDYFYVDVSGFSQIKVDTLAGNDLVEFTGTAHPALNTVSNLGQGDNRLYVNTPGYHSALLGNGRDMVVARIGASTIPAKLDLQSGGGDDSVDILNFFVSADLGDGKDRLSARMLPGSSIRTGNGDDFVSIGGTSQMRLSTGSGADTLQMGDVDSSWIDTGSGNDSIDAFGLHQSQLWMSTGNDNVVLVGHDNRVWTGTGNDIVSSRQSTGNVIRTEAGNDLVYSVDSSNSIDLGTGNDSYSTSFPQLTGIEDSSSDIVLGGLGNDVFQLLGGNVIAFGESGRDIFDISQGQHTLDGGMNTDFYFSRGGQSTVNMGRGQRNYLAHQPEDKIVKGANDFLIRSGTPYTPLSRSEYLQLLLPHLIHLQNQGMRLPQLA
jgi:hypothetical protein